MDKLKIGLLANGDPFTLPADLGDKKFALLAQSKKGKTYGLGDVLEELTEAKRPWSVFDPGNNLWGLRVLPDGRPSGLPIVVMGGNHGDLELEKDAGERVAEAFLADPICLVIDVTFESKNVTRKFVTDYCSTLMRKRAVPERVIFFEEAPEFVPQSANYSGIQVCKAAVDRIIRIGGNLGYGAWLISQRSATIDKDVLSQCEALIVMGLTDKRDRKAVKDWMLAKDIDQKMAQCFDELGSLQPGEAWLWWPGEDRFERFTFRKRRTLHPRDMKKLGLKPTAIELGDARLFVERLKRGLTRTVVTVCDVPRNPKTVKALVRAAEITAESVTADLVEIQDLRLAKANLEGQISKLHAAVQAQRSRAAAAERRLEAVRAHLKPEYDALAKLFQDLGAVDRQDLGAVDPAPYLKMLEKAPKDGIRVMLQHLIEKGEATRYQLSTIAGVNPVSTYYEYQRWLVNNGLAEKTPNGLKLRAV